MIPDAFDTLVLKPSVTSSTKLFRKPLSLASVSYQHYDSQLKESV